MRIPPEIIEEIRTSADIVEIVSEYVTLKKRGQNYFGLCPFHTEKTPSFSVHPGKQIFHCFGCGEGGNVITFLMKIEKLSFVEAVQLLARRLHIEIPERREFSEAEKRKLRLYDVNAFARSFFEKNFWGEAGREARQYMMNRGFSEETLRRFGIGFAPEGWDNLIRAAVRQGISVEELKAVGLAVPNEKGGYYDRFRGRVMFPIYNLSGMVVAFGGRILNEQPGVPKYINSPETPVYQKGRLLYGLWQNRESVRKQEFAILVEGYADLLSLVQAGIHNVVATLGTALTATQARLLLRYAPAVTVLYDGDLAGANAALRGVDILLQEGMQVKVVQLPEDSDPDDFVRQHGAEGLYRLLNRALDLVDFKIEAFRRTEGLDTTQKRARLVHMLAETVASIQDEVAKNLYIQDIARKVNVAETAVFKAVARLRTRRQPEAEQETSPKPAGSRIRAEEDLLKIMIRFPPLVPLIYRHLSLDEISHETYREIFSHIYTQLVDTGTVQPQHVLDVVQDPDIQRVLARVLVEEEERPPDRAVRQWASDCLRQIKLARLHQEIEAVREKIRQCSPASEQLTALNQRYVELKRREQELRRKDFIPQGEE
jgi:DNA primase